MELNNKKLLLTSDGLSNSKIQKHFLDLTNKNPEDIRVLFVTTAACDEGDKPYLVESESELVDLGILKKNIVWVNILTNTKTENFDVMYVCGGNTFYLMNEIKKTGFDKEIDSFVEGGNLYVGVSAGSLIVCPDISIAAPFDENDVNLESMNGLNFINKVVSPHYQRKEKEIIDVWENSHTYKVIRLNDGQAVEVNGNKQRVI